MDQSVHSLEGLSASRLTFFVKGIEVMIKYNTANDGSGDHFIRFITGISRSSGQTADWEVKISTSVSG